ncbi:MAG: alanine racemase [Candidatus Abyssubacteria bacterium]
MNPCKQMRLRATKAIVDLTAIEHNMAQIRKRVGDAVEILAVVKADAYGHGAPEVSRACQRAGAAMLGVALVEEGAQLREAGITLPILVQCCVADTEIEAALDCDLTLTVASAEFAQRVSEKAAAKNMVAKVHVDIDTGMGRIGFPHNSAVEQVARVARLPNLALDGIYTHFATSELENDSYTRQQIATFQEILAQLQSMGIRPPRRHAANSGAVINYPDSHLTLVRPGLMLYGVYPHKNLRSKVNLRPALSFQSAIVFLKEIAQGTSLGYGRTFVAAKKMKIATLNVGYADGYQWRLSNNARAIVRGRFVPVVGRVSMDQLLLDVTDLPVVQVGDTVTLLGNDGSSSITAEEMADWAGIIPYEILCAISKRVPRLYRS